MSSPSDIAAALMGVIGANDDDTTVDSFLDTGFPPLNFASTSTYGHGLPVGRIVEIAGPPSSGKTAISTACMAAAQKAGGVAGFCDHERSFSTVLAPRLGLDVTPGRFIFKKPRTFEQSLQYCITAATIIREKKLIKPDAPICWVFDSLASMVPQSALYEMKGGKIVGERAIEDRNMNDNTALARATSAAFPTLAQQCDELGICAIFLNQMRMKIGVLYGDPRKTTGGNAPEFYFSQRLWLSASQIKKGTETIGMEVTGKFMKNKIAAPFKEASWRFMFNEDGTGRFDRERSMVDFLDTVGAFTGSARKGFVNFGGKEIGKEALARQIEAGGDAAYAELLKLMPADYDPPTVEEFDMDLPGVDE